MNRSMIFHFNIMSAFAHITITELLKSVSAKNEHLLSPMSKSQLGKFILAAIHEGQIKPEFLL